MQVLIKFFSQTHPINHQDFGVLAEWDFSGSQAALGTSEHQLSTPGDYSTTCNVVYREEQSRAAIPLPDVAGAQL